MKSALREIGLRIGFAILAGVIIGVLDLWVFELSWRGFLAGLVAGITYFLVILFVYQQGMRQFRWLVAALAVLAGATGAMAWWSITRSGSPWLAASVGSVLALSHFAGDGQFRRYR